MKKLFALLLAVAMILTLTACGDKGSDKGVSNNAEDVAKAIAKAEVYSDIKEMKTLWAYDYEAELKDEALEEFDSEEEFFEALGDEYDEEITSWNDAFAVVKKSEREYLEDRYGEDFTVTVSVEESVEMDEDELADTIAELIDDHEDYVNESDLSKVKEGMIVTVTVVVKGENQENENSSDVYLIKVGGKWKVAYF